MVMECYSTKKYYGCLIQIKHMFDKRYLNVKRKGGRK